jgi:hypothetical protein
MNVFVNLNSGALGVTNKLPTNTAQNLINRYEVARTALVMMFGNSNLGILDGESPKHLTHPTYDIQQERKPGRGKSVSAKTNAKLVIKQIVDRSSQGWNQFRIAEPPSVEILTGKCSLASLVSAGLAKSVSNGAVCGPKSRLPAFKSHRNILKRVVPFHLAILVEESRGRGGGVLS